MSFVHGTKPSATMFAPTRSGGVNGLAERGGAPRAMDDLDRLAFRLVRIIRQRYPQLQTYGFTLTDLEETLLPFRESRREMANGSADMWERTMLRLIAGEREYLATDPELQRACTHALRMPSPTVALVRAWATSTIRLGEASRAFSAGMADEPSSADGTVTSTGGARDARDARDARREPTCGPTNERSHESSAVHCCRYCGNRLPEARSMTYCPHCGLDLSKRQCPACSTQLELAWRYCVTCGRESDSASGSEGAVMMARTS